MPLLKPLSRRTVLRGAGSILVGLPFLEAMEARAQSTRIKRYLGFWYSGAVGTSAYWPSGSESAFQLSNILSPLEPHRAELLIPDGLNIRLTGGGDAHTQAINGVFTGTSQSNYAKGPSIDQAIAAKIGANSRFKSIQVGVGVDVSSPWSRCTHSGRDAPIAPDTDPRSVFNRLFCNGTGGNGGNAEAAAAALAEKKSILDATMESYKGLLGRVGAGDRQRLDAHLTSIRELEGRISELPPTSCNAPTQPTMGSGPFSNVPAIGRAQMDLVATAFACDQTRVATMQWGRAAIEQTFSWLGMGNNQHYYSHNGAQPRAEMATMAKWYIEQFAYLVGKLKTMQEAGGSVLDNTVAFCVAEHSSAHSGTRIPIVMAGKGGGSVRTGRLLKFNSRPHNDLLAGIGNVFDLNLSTFGEFGTGTPITLV